jgi:glycosyltransferase involved in cell wall biosynthesis/SAM-dependent methyltransferase
MIDGIRVTRTWIYPGTGRSAAVRLLNYLSFTFTALIAVLRRKKPDVLFVESQPLSLGLIAIVMRVFKRVPYVYNVPDLQIDVAEQAGFISNSRFLKVATGLENYFLKRSWKVATVTRRFIQHFEGRGIPSENLTFLPNGADTSVLRPLEPDGSLADHWNLRDKVTFAYVGTHAYYHGLETLIDAAALLKDDSSLHLLVAGDGPERAGLMRKVDHLKLRNVSFVGPIEYEDLAAFYSLAHASIVLLRDMEVSRSMRPSKIFPAMACGVPVIFSGEGETAGLLDSASAGISVKPGDANALAAAMRRLASDPDLRDAMAKAGRAFIEEHFSWELIVDRWLGELADDKSAAAVEPGGEAIATERARIKRDYAHYESRGHLRGKWNSRNPGNKAMVAERNAALGKLLTEQGFLPFSGRLLEVGCGAGEFLASLGDLAIPGERCFGVDLLADRFKPLRGGGYPAVSVADGANLPFKSVSFDVVVLSVTMSSIRSREMKTAVAREVDRVLRPGGAIIWYDLRLNSPRNRAVRRIPMTTVRSWFPGYRCAWEPISLLPPLARRLGPATGVLYPALARVPLLKSHNLALLVKPEERE